MRNELKKRNETRLKCFGTFNKLGYKSGWFGEHKTTVLLTDITDSEGNYLTEHLWFNMTKQFEKLVELSEGTKLTFEARVKSYEKGYVNYRKGIYDKSSDYKLSYPTKIEIVTSA